MNLSLLSTYRTQLMGIATLMIVICHSVGFGCYCPNFLLDTFIRHGSLGVDIFLFLSGLGCWYSLNQDKLVGGVNCLIINGLQKDFSVFLCHTLFVISYLKG